MRKLFLAAIIGVLSFAQTTRSVVLSWPASSTPGVTYNVYRSTLATGTFSKINTTPISGLSYTDTTAVVGQGAYYTATAVLACQTPPQNPCGESAQSSPAVGIAAVPAQPATPGPVILIIQ